MVPPGPRQPGFPPRRSGRIRGQEKGKPMSDHASDHAQDADDIRREFGDLVNMTAEEMRRWLDTPESWEVGWHDEGEAESVATARVRQLRAGFDEVWERSRPVSELPSRSAYSTSNRSTPAACATTFASSVLPVPGGP